MRLFLGLLFLASLSLGPDPSAQNAFAQDNFDIPPPPPLEIDDYEDPMIIEPMDDIPMDADIVDGPVYDPEMDAPPPIPPPMSPGVSPESSRFGLSRGGAPPSSGGARGGGAFGATPKDGVRFQIVEGEFWEKGKKRSRKEKTPD